MRRKKQQNLKQRIRRVRAKVSGSKERPRLSVYRSLAHVYAALIDDEKGRTMATATDLGSKNIKEQKDSRKAGRKTENAYEVGKLIAEKAKELGVSSVVFDRRGRKYHGRVKAVAEGAREGGLKF